MVSPIAAILMINARILARAGLILPRLKDSIRNFLFDFSKQGFRPVAAPLSSRRTADGRGPTPGSIKRVVSEMSRDDVALAAGSVCRPLRDYRDGAATSYGQPGEDD